MIQLNEILAALFILIAIVHITVLGYCLTLRTIVGAKPLSGMLIAVALYCFGYGMEILSPDVHRVQTWLSIEQLGLLFFPAFLFLTIWEILFQETLRKTATFALFIIPLISIVLHYTNDQHNLYFASITINHSGPFSTITLVKGPWYWVQIAYCNVSIAISAILTIWTIYNKHGRFRTISGIILVALLFPWVAHVLYILPVIPRAIEIAPFTLSIASSIIAYAFTRQRFLNILPMAYDALFHNLPDGVLVADDNGTIIGHNESAEKILGVPITGISSLYTILPELRDMCNEPKIERNCIIEKKHEGRNHWIDVRGNLFETHNGNKSKIITLRDITEIKTLETAIKANEKKMRDEINMVRNIQAALIPKFSMVPNYDIASIYLPADDLSGDFIDAFFIDDETYQIVICDVMGHGLASAYLGMEIRSLFRAISPGKYSPAHILREVNNTLSNDFSKILYFATAAIAQIDLYSNTIRYSAAGHPPALHRTASGTIVEMGFTGALMGLYANNEYDDIIISTFLDSEQFLMYTDGVIESRKEGIGEIFEKERLKDAFAIVDYASRDCLHAIINSVFEFMEYTPLEDDISMVCFKRK